MFDFGFLILGSRLAFEGPPPHSKRRTLFQMWRILEKPGDLFEDAHPVPRCALKVRIFDAVKVRSFASFVVDIVFALMIGCRPVPVEGGRPFG